MKKIALLAIFTLIFLTGVHTLFSQEDVTPPELQSFEFTPQTIDVSGGSQSITVTVRVTDALSGVSGGYLYFNGPSSTQTRGGNFGWWCLIEGDSHDGTYQFTVDFPQYSEAGEWQASLVVINDALENYRQYGKNDLVAKGFPTVLTVLGGPDLAPPELQSLEFTPQTIDVSGGSQSITVTVRVTDALSGVSGGYLYFNGPSSTQTRGGFFGWWCLIEGDSHDGTYQFTVDFPQYSEAGEWQASLIVINDAVANYRQYGKNDLVAMGFPTILTVLSNPSDTTPPVLQSFEFTPQTIDVSGGSQSITVTVRVTDALSGVSGGYLYFNGPSSTQTRGGNFGWWCLIEGDSHDGTYQLTVDFPQYSEAGEWQASLVVINDALENYRQYGKNDLVAMGFPTILHVSENQNPIAEAGPESSALVTEQVQFDGNSSSDADGYIAAWVWDFGDGSPEATGASVSHAYAQSGQFTVTLTVTDNDGAMGVDQTLVVVKSPIAAVGDLITDVTSSITGSLQKSLLSKLNSAIDALNKKNDAAAVNKLILFIQEVNAQKAKKIPGDVADRLIALANRIIAAVQAGANTLQASTVNALARAESTNLLKSPGSTAVEMLAHTIRLRVEEPGIIVVAITDSKGNSVGSISKRFERAGDYVLLWNGLDFKGDPCPKGVYGWRVVGDPRAEARGIIIIR